MKSLARNLKNLFYAYGPCCRTILESSLFDAAYYRQQIAGRRTGSELALLRHYIVKGFLYGCDPHPLFSTSFYLNANSDVIVSGINPLVHYLLHGACEGTDPHPLFAAGYYLQMNPDVGEAGMNPLVHYLLSGWREGRDPHPLFSTSSYLENTPEAGEGGENPLVHYLFSGWREGRDPHPLFSTSYYLEKYPEVGERGDNPLIHYLLHGWREGRDPHPLFDSSFYLDKNRGVRVEGMNPLSHYLLHGSRAGYDPHPLFSTSFYLKGNPDVCMAGINPLVHYVQSGGREYRDPHPLFDTDWYVAGSSGANGAGVSPLMHYVLSSMEEKQDPHPLFSVSHYLAGNPEVAESGTDPLIHYILRGGSEGRDPHPLFDTACYIKNTGSILGEAFNPLQHFLVSCPDRTASPHPLFSMAHYLEKNPDIDALSLNPLIHYLKNGHREFRNPHWLFNTRFYCRRYGDKLGRRENPLVHFCLHGLAERTDPHPLFSTEYYLQKNPEAIASGLNPLVHFLARESVDGDDRYLYRRRRARTVRSILILEPGTLRFDQDSGSLRLFHIIRMLVQSGYEVIVWSPFEAGAERYAARLRDIGVELPWREDGLEQYLETSGDGIDMIVLCRKTGADLYLDLVMAMTEARIVFDTVDLHFLREERKARLTGGVIDSKGKQDELTIAQCADTVMVVSPFEKEVLADNGVRGKVSVVTNIHELMPPGPAFAERLGLMFIGGFAHQPNVDGMLWFVREIFPLITEKLPDMHLDIVGSRPPPSIRSLASENIRVTGYVEDVSGYFGRARVFVSPLRYGAGVKGKIGQSLAYRLPVVTTSIGAEGMYLEDGVNAMIADAESEFAEKVIRLYQDRSLWELLSRNSAGIIERYFSPEVVRRALLAMIEGDEVGGAGS